MSTEDKSVQHTPEKTAKEKIQLAVIWCVQYWRELFNFRFDKYMIAQVLPGVYALLLVSLGLSILVACGMAFYKNIWLGIFFTLIPAPLGFLVAASVLRALLEFYLVVFKISEHVDELVGLRDTVDRLSGISDTVDEMVAVTRRIPFWRAMSAPNRSRPAPRGRRFSDRKIDRDDDKAEQKS